MAEQVKLAAEETSAEELKDWPMPVAVRLIAERSHGLQSYPATKAVWERILGNVIQVGCTSSSLTVGDSGVPHPRGALILPGSYWATLVAGSSEFWDGHVQFRLQYDTYRGVRMLLRCFGLRLNPAHVAQEFPMVAPAFDPSLTRPDRKGLPQPAPAHLKAWFNVFSAAYPKGTEDEAMASAEGMFPDKWIVRQRVRELMGPRQMGRPTKER